MSPEVVWIISDAVGCGSRLYRADIVKMVVFVERVGRVELCDRQINGTRY